MGLSFSQVENDDERHKDVSFRVVDCVAKTPQQEYHLLHLG